MSDPAVQRFPSRIDAWFVAVMLAATAVLAFAFVQVARAGHGPVAWVLMPIGAIAMGLPLWIWAATRYVIDERHLHVQSGPFRWRVPLDQVRRVTASHSVLSAPALSLQRLCIDYGRSGGLLISPRDRTGFLQVLRQRCPQAELADV